MKMTIGRTRSRWMAPIAILATCLTVSTCSSPGLDIQSGGTMVEVPGYGKDVWVTDDDILEDDLDLLVDLSVKMEFMRLELVKLLSNNFEGGKLFCGVADIPHPGPILDCFTRLMADEDQYKAALERLGASALMTPTSKGWVGNTFEIFNACAKEGKLAQTEILDNLKRMDNFDDTARQQLYDFYVEQEPGYARRIGAKDAKDFFNKLNNGELNAYTVNISHIWRDIGILESDITGNRVGDYATLANTGKPAYLEAAYRVSSKVAVNLGELYLSGIDKMAGGYGGKIIELGDAVKNKIEFLRLAKQSREGKPDWQGWNKFIVDNLMGEVKQAITEAMGGDKMNFGEDVINQIAERLCDELAEMCTSEDAEEAGDNKEKENVKTAAEADELAIIEIYTDFGSQAKLVLITDDNTGTISMGRPSDDGRLSIVTTPGRKTLTIVKSNGERLTKHIEAKAGFNTVSIYFDKKPYLNTNPRTITLDGGEDDAYAAILTNCQYVKIHYPDKKDWFEADIKAYGESLELSIHTEANDTGMERSGSLVLQGWNDPNALKPAVTYTVPFKQWTPPENQPGISTTKLEFEAGGGTQSVTMIPGGYTRYGYTINKDYTSWLSAKVPGGGVVEITAKPNDTDQQREGIVMCYVTNEQEPTEDQKVTFPVKVVQKAGAKGNIAFGSISVSVFVNANYTNTYGHQGPNESTGFTYNYAANADKISVRSYSGGLIISGEAEENSRQEYTGGYWLFHENRQIKITLSASDINDPETYVIQSAEFTIVTRGDLEDPLSSPESQNETRYLSMSHASIPLTSHKNNVYKYELLGESITTEIDINAYWKWEWDHGYDGTGWQQEKLLSFITDKDNSIKISLATK